MTDTTERKPARGDQVLVTTGRGGSQREVSATVLKSNGTTLLVQTEEKTQWVHTRRTRHQPQSESA